MLARNDSADRLYALEAETESRGNSAIDSARRLGAALKRLIAPLLRLAQILRQQLDDEYPRYFPADAQALTRDWNAAPILVRVGSARTAAPATRASRRS